MRILLLILLLTVVPVMDGQAATLDVYTGEAVVENKLEAERARALPLALQHVLQKLSGLRSLDDYPHVGPALGIAPTILLSLHYRNAESIMPDGSTRDELRLVARFSSEKTDELARALQLPLWPKEREPVDFWIVVDNGLDRQIMPLEFSYAWQALVDVAAWRGLPVNWPEADENGQYAIDPQLLWGGYTEDIGEGQGRAAMISAVRREGPEWNVRSNLAYNNESWSWRVQDIDIRSALIESLQQAVDLIAAANTIAAADLSASMSQLTVDGIHSSADYFRCLGYLQEVGVVSQVSVVSAQPGNVTFNLELNALPRYLDEALISGQFLGFDESRNTWFLLP